MLGREAQIVCRYVIYLQYNTIQSYPPRHESCRGGKHEIGPTGPRGRSRSLWLLLLLFGNCCSCFSSPGCKIWRFYLSISDYTWSMLPIADWKCLETQNLVQTWEKLGPRRTTRRPREHKPLRAATYNSQSYNIFRVSFDGPTDLYASGGGFVCSKSSGKATTATTEKANLRSS